MFIALLLLAAAPTLGEVQRLPPDAAGTLALGDYPHEPIVQVEPGPDGLRPPGSVELQMVERPVAVDGGCVRQRWTVSFQTVAGKPFGAALLSRAGARSEIALRPSRACPSTGYVAIDPGLTPAPALAALALLHAWQAGHHTPQYRCIDRTYSDLCASPAGTAKEVATARPWMISRSGLFIAFWLGTPGGIVTELRYFPAGDVTVAIVERRVPAPF